MKSITYWRPGLYKLLMQLSYRKQYNLRFQRIVNLVLPDTVVVDYCCGDAMLCLYLADKPGVSYIGVDFNEFVIAKLKRQENFSFRKLNLREDDLIEGDYAVMMASLYQFFPDHKDIVDKILRVSKEVIISEPVQKNLAQSSSWFSRQISYSLTNPGDGPKRYRFTAESLRSFFDEHYRNRIISFLHSDTDLEMIVRLRGDL